MEEDIQTILQLSCFTGHPVFSRYYGGSAFLRIRMQEAKMLQIQLIRILNSSLLT